MSLCTKSTALFGDIAANYDVDYIQTCQYLFNDKDIDEGGTCFCRHCIAEAKRTGFDLKAAYTFNESSGIYDIRITYFDEEDGKSQITLLMAGEEKASFKLDEDTDC